MDLQKEREAFQECYKTSRDYKFYVRHEMSEKQIFEFKKGKYVVDCVNDGWKIWQAAKAQAIPEGFVLVPKEPTDAMLFAASGRDIVAEHYGDENIMWPELRETWKAMLEAARGGNE